MKTTVKLLFLCVCADRLCRSWGITVSGVHVNKIFLKQNNPNSPYCFVASSASEIAKKNSGPSVNFLATQVWPSARVAAAFVAQHMNPSWTICEFGCGPGLPSLTAAKLKAKKVVATDLDPLALELVQRAGEEQGLTAVLETLKLDLTKSNTSSTKIPRADLFVFSDVFESSSVSIGAAHTSEHILKGGARVWVFAQSDRVQREIYLNAMKARLKDPSLSWEKMSKYDPNKHKLFLCDVDETTVPYG